MMYTSIRVDLNAGPRPSAPFHPDTARGYTLLDLLLVIAISSLLAFITVPRFEYWAGGVQVRIAAQQVAHSLGEARMRAIRYQQKVAVKFREDDDNRITLALYRDVDGDGVRNQDIDAGVDELLKAPRRLVYGTRNIQFGFPPGEAPTDPSNHRRRVTRTFDPIRFNRSDLASFTSLGTATPGTVYLTDGRYHLAAVRVTHVSAKVTILLYDRKLERWRRIG